MSTMLPDDFDPRSVPPSTGGGDQLPISDAKGHLVVITGDEMRNTNDNTGAYLALTLTVVEGHHEGASGLHRLNIANQSADAVRIAYQQLSSICHAVGHLEKVRDISVLHNRPFRVVVEIQKGKEAEGYTRVKKVLTASGGTPGEIPQSAAPTMVQQAPAPVMQQAPAPVMQQAMPQAPQITNSVPFPQAQAPQAPQAPFPQVQAPQAPGFPQSPQAPQAPPMPQAPFPQAPQMPQMPQAPQAPQAPAPAVPPWLQQGQQG